MTEMKNYYITKYALTKGIITVEMPDDHKPCNESNILSVAFDPENPNRRECFCKNDWYENWSDAVIRAETMKQAKIKSMQKALTKLKDLTW